MNYTLSQEQRSELTHLFLQADFTIDIAVRKLMSWGYDEMTAKHIIIAEFQEFKKAYFHQKVKNEEQGKTREGLFVMVVLLSMISTLFGSQSPVWHGFVAIASGVAGYFMFRSKPIAGIVGSITFAIVMPLAYNFYFTGRTYYLNIEVAIPILIAVAPAAIMYYFLAFTVYPDREDI